MSERYTGYGGGFSDPDAIRERVDILFKETAWYRRLRRRAGWKPISQDEYDRMDGFERSMGSIGYAANVKMREERAVAVMTLRNGCFGRA